MLPRFYILKTIVALFLIFNSSISACQSLKNTEWTRVLVENEIDGSIIVNQQLSQKSIKYLFQEDTVLISTNESYSDKALYSINGGILSIGDFVKYKIDSLSEQVLIVSDVPKQGIVSSRLGIYTLMNTNYIFDFLQQSHQLTIIDDSVIVANELYCPIFNGEINDVFSLHSGEFAFNTYTGSFTIGKDGNIKDIQIALLKKGKKDDIRKISEMLTLTKGYWVIPPMPRPFDLKVNFELKIAEMKDFIGSNFTLHPANK